MRLSPPGTTTLPGLFGQCVHLTFQSRDEVMREIEALKAMVENLERETNALRRKVEGSNLSKILNPV